MQIYNSMDNQKQEFISIKPQEVSMYVCGPTVYNYIHLGNARPFVVFDTVRRYFEYKGYKVNYVQNFTDIDDKIINRAVEEKCSTIDVSKKYIKEALEDIKGLNIKEYTYTPKVTEEIESIINMISILEEKGFAYNINGTVYFDTSKYDEYGKLSKKDIEGLDIGNRVEFNSEKRNGTDFVLWKSKKENEPFWESPWGDGRPGWHIECSAMAKKYLGDTIDIHAGGQDLIFPHHENELAQSECANKKAFAHYWMHNGIINIDNEKMSKSKNNFFIVRDIAKDFSYNTIRFFLLSVHYRSPINFTVELLKSSENSFNRINMCVINLEFIKNNTKRKEITDEELNLLKEIEKFVEKFEQKMDDDFNTADAISVIFEMIKFVNKNVNNESSIELCDDIINTIKKLCDVLGLIVKNESVDTISNSEIEELILKRQNAKKNKDFTLADDIRNNLLEKGIVIEDTRQGVKWYKR